MPNTIADNLARLQQAKSDIANAIIAKGGTVNSGDGLEDFVNGILTIPGMPEMQCLEFVGTDSFTLKTMNGKTWSGIIEYSVDKVTWTEWDGSSVNAISSGVNNKLYIRGRDHNKLTGSSAGTQFVFTTNGVIDCIGDVDLLLDYRLVSLGYHPRLDSNAYSNLFKNCTKLRTAPEITNTTASYACYNYMFRGCSNLVNPPPILPATSCVGYCYSGMFYGCTMLSTIPKIMATSIDANSMSYMFQDCTSLEQLPKLYPTYIAGDGYRFMFDGCSSIKLSKTQTDEYSTPYRIPIEGSGSWNYGSSCECMFYGTGGTFTYETTYNSDSASRYGPYLNTTYYTSNTVV